MAARALVSVPATAQRGAIIEIKVLIAHPMESGYRVGYSGKLIPRDIITLFTCTYDDTEVFRAEFSSAVAANPFVTFHTIATETGTLHFRWTGDNAFEASEQAAITVA